MLRNRRRELPINVNPLIEEDKYSAEQWSKRLVMREVKLTNSAGAKELRRLLWLKLDLPEEVSEEEWPTLYKKLPDDDVDEKGDNEEDENEEDEESETSRGNNVYYCATSFYDAAYPWAVDDEIRREETHVMLTHGGKEIPPMQGLWVDEESAEVLAKEYGIYRWYKVLRDGPNTFSQTHPAYRKRPSSKAHTTSPELQKRATASPAAREESEPPTVSPTERTRLDIPLPKPSSETIAQPLRGQKRDFQEVNHEKPNMNADTRNEPPARELDLQRKFESHTEVTASKAAEAANHSAEHVDESKNEEEDDSTDSRRKRPRLVEEVEEELCQSRRNVRLLSLLALGLGASALIPYVT